MDYPKSVPNVGLVDGKFVDENTTTGTVGSLIPSSWGNAVTDEIINVIVAAGIAPDESNKAQLVEAIRRIGAAPAGGARGMKMSVTAASANATLTADEITVKTVLGGQAWLLPNFNKSANLGTVGPGGMDTGTAPVSGFVALYAIYNPTTKTSDLLAVNATSVKAPDVYGGANMPPGYTASALVSVWPTDAARSFKIGFQVERTVSFSYISAAATSVAIPTLTAVAVSTAIPLNARSCGGWGSIGTTNAQNGSLNIAGSASGIGFQQIAGSLVTSSNIFAGSFADIPLVTPQVMYWQASASSGTVTSANINISRYTF